MKTPEEIKKALACTNETADCDHCAYCTTKTDVDGWDWPEYSCIGVEDDALDYIQQLESDNENKQKRIEELESRLAQTERERDALLRIVQDAKPGRECKHYKKRLEKTKTSIVNWMACPVCQKFEWRGPCAENTKEADSGGETTSASDA